MNTSLYVPHTLDPREATTFWMLATACGLDPLDIHRALAHADAIAAHARDLSVGYRSPALMVWLCRQRCPRTGAPVCQRGYCTAVRSWRIDWASHDTMLYSVAGGFRREAFDVVYFAG